MVDDEKIWGMLRSWVPFVEPDRVGDDNHFKLNGFLNGWYVDIHDLCEVRHLCQRNADGTYDLSMIIEFWPQRWFYLGMLISGTTFAGCLGYLVYDVVRRKKVT